ncbi:hypothetical protein HK098_005787 [Nowakowskiella sp. JEL0407]|nr:hypothetical protein HK098_005787 [Nowakowskiella sp. JEL0407]
MLKMQCAWLLGLGSVVAFGLLGVDAQKKHLNSFTNFINFVVLGNIAMMFFLPIDNTMRGYSHRVVCALLVIWLAKEMQKVRWNTVYFFKGYFLFNASPMSWVICHALYRSVMVTLPIFDTQRYFVLEPLSLGIMMILYRTSGKNDGRVSDWFGISDTMVVSTITFMTSVADAYLEILPRIILNDQSLMVLDGVAVLIHLMIGVVALAWSNVFLDDSSWTLDSFSAYREELLFDGQQKEKVKQDKKGKIRLPILKNLKSDLIASAKSIQDEVCSVLNFNSTDLGDGVNGTGNISCPKTGLFSSEFWSENLLDKSISIGLLISSCPDSHHNISRKLVIEVSGCDKLSGMHGLMGRHPPWINTLSVSQQSQVELFGVAKESIKLSTTSGRAAKLSNSKSSLVSCDKVCEDGSIAVIDEWIKHDLETNPAKLILFSETPLSDCTAGYLAFTGDLFADLNGRIHVDFPAIDKSNIWNDESIALISGNQPAVCPTVVETSVKKNTPELFSRPLLRKKLGIEARKCEEYLDSLVDGIVFKSLYEKYLDHEKFSTATDPWPTVYEIISGNLISNHSDIDDIPKFVKNLPKLLFPQLVEFSNNGSLAILSPLIIPPFNDAGPENVSDLFGLIQFAVTFASVNPQKEAFSTPRFPKSKFPSDLQFLGSIFPHKKAVELLPELSDEVIEVFANLPKHCAKVDLSYHGLYSALSELEVKPCRETLFGGLGERLGHLSPQKTKQDKPNAGVNVVSGNLDEVLSELEGKQTYVFSECEEGSYLKVLGTGPIQWENEVARKEFESTVFKIRAVESREEVVFSNLKWGVGVVLDESSFFNYLKLNLTNEKKVVGKEIIAEGVAEVVESQSGRAFRKEMEQIARNDESGVVGELQISVLLGRRFSGATDVKILLYDSFKRGTLFSTCIIMTETFSGFKSKPPVGSFPATLICSTTSPLLQGREGMGLDNPEYSLAKASLNAAAYKRKFTDIFDGTAELPSNELHPLLELFRNIENVKSPVEIPLRWHVISYNLRGSNLKTPYLREILAHVIPQSPIVAFQDALRLESIDDLFFPVSSVVHAEQDAVAHPGAAAAPNTPAEDRAIHLQRQRIRKLFEMTDRCGSEGYVVSERLGSFESQVEEMLMGGERVVLRSDIFEVLDNCVLHKKLRSGDGVMDKLLQRYLNGSHKNLMKVPGVVLVGEKKGTKKFAIVNVDARRSTENEIEFLLVVLEFVRSSYGYSLIVTGSFSSDFMKLTNSKLAQSGLLKQYYPVTWTDSVGISTVHLFSPYSQLWFPDLPLASQTGASLTSALAPLAYMHRDVIDRTKLCMVVDEEINYSDQNSNVMEAKGTAVAGVRAGYCKDMAAYNKWFWKNIGLGVDRLPARYESCAVDYSGSKRDKEIIAESLESHYPISYNISAGGDIFRIVSFNLNGLDHERANVLLQLDPPSQLFTYFSSFDIVVIQGDASAGNETNVSNAILSGIQAIAETIPDKKYEWKSSLLNSKGGDSEQNMQIYWRESSRLKGIVCTVTPYTPDSSKSLSLLGCAFEVPSSLDSDFFIVTNVHDSKTAYLTNAAVDLPDSSVSVMKRNYQVLCRAAISKVEHLGMEVDADGKCRQYPIPAAFIGTFHPQLKVEFNSTFAEFEAAMNGVAKEILRKNQIGDRKFPQGYNQNLIVQSEIPPETVTDGVNSWVPMADVQSSGGVMGWLFGTAKPTKLWPYATDSAGDVSDMLISWSESKQNQQTAASDFVVPGSGRIDTFLGSPKCRREFEKSSGANDGEIVRAQASCAASDPPCGFTLSSHQQPVGVKVVGTGLRRRNGITPKRGTGKGECVAVQVENLRMKDALSSSQLNLDCANWNL